MQSTAERKEAIRKYKEQKTVAGVFAVHCTATRQSWVGSSRNLDAARNHCWFALRQGVHLDRSLQGEWNVCGESAFQYEVLETFGEDVLPMAVKDLLKEKKNHWVAQLGARPV